MCCFGGSSAGESGWVGVREVMEEICKDQVRKGLICSAQELGIFPEGTLCVCVWRETERESEQIWTFTDCSYCSTEGDGNLEHWGKVFSPLPFQRHLPWCHTLCSLRSFRLHPLLKPSTRAALGHCSSTRLLTPSPPLKTQLILQSQASKIILTCAFCQVLWSLSLVMLICIIVLIYYFKWFKPPFEPC